MSIETDSEFENLEAFLLWLSWNWRISGNTILNALISLSCVVAWRKFSLTFLRL